MKHTKNELNVDFIGGLGPLTKEEEKAISKFIKASKARKQKRTDRKKARTANKNIAANGTLLTSAVVLDQQQFRPTNKAKQKFLSLTINHS